MTLKANFSRYRGDSYPISTVIKDAGAVVNIDGYKFVMTVVESVKTVDTPQLVVEGVIDEPTTGEVKFPFTGDSFNTVGVFSYDIQMTKDTGEIYTLAVGKITVTQDITQ